MYFIIDFTFLFSIYLFYSSDSSIYFNLLWVLNSLSNFFVSYALFVTLCVHYQGDCKILLFNEDKVFYSLQMHYSGCVNFPCDILQPKAI